MKKSLKEKYVLVKMNRLKLFTAKFLLQIVHMQILIFQSLSVALRSSTYQNLSCEQLTCELIDQNVLIGDSGFHLSIFSF